jgi:putative endonuclease
VAPSRASASSARARSLPRAGRNPTTANACAPASPAAESAASALTRTRDRHDAKSGSTHRSDELRAGITHRGRPGIADVGDALAAREPCEHAARGGALVVLVHGNERLGDSEVAQQRSAVARVLASDGIDHREHVQGAQGQVGEVADRRRDDVERGRGILLAGGGRCRGLDELRSLGTDETSGARTTMTTQPTTKALGEAAEARALAHLGAAGLGAGAAQLSRRARPRARGGEVDLVMRERDGTIVFIEVRARSDSRFGGASCLRRATSCAGSRTRPPCRFDVVAIDGERIEWLRAAFDAG